MTKSLDDPETRYLYEERAAIMEYDGGLSRDEAERLAAVDVLGAGSEAVIGKP
jgi:hypothetical protein